MKAEFQISPETPGSGLASWKWAQLPLPSRQAGNPHLPQGECLLWENSRQRAQGGVQGWGRLLVDLWPQVHNRGQQGHTGETSDQRTHSQSPACSFYEFYRFSSHIRLMVDLELIFARDVRECPPLLFACGSLVVSAPFFGTDSSVPTELSWHPCRESIDYRCEDFFLDSIISLH